MSCRTRRSSRRWSGSRPRLPRRTRTRSTAGPVPERGDRCTAGDRRALRARPSGARRRRRLDRGDRERVLHARQALRRDGDGVRHAPDPGRVHRPAPKRQRLVRAVPPRPRRRPAPDRLRDFRGRDRRRHGPLGRLRRDGRRALLLREAGADRQLRQTGRRPLDHDAARRTPTAATRSPCSRTRNRSSSSRPARGIRSACAARARRASRSALRSRPSRSWATFAAIAAQTMVPVSHILWSHIWLGIATDAFDRARTFVQGLGSAEARDSRCPPPGSRT